MKIIMLLLVILNLNSCNHNDKQSEKIDAQNEVESESTSLSADNLIEYSESPNQQTAMPQKAIKRRIESENDPLNQVDKKIIRNAMLRIHVKDIRESETRIQTQLKKYKAEIMNSNFAENSYSFEMDISVRIHFKLLDSIINDISTIEKKIVHQQISRRDVTEDYYDTESQITNKIALETQYRNLLKQAKNMSDILEITEKLNQIRFEIDQLSGINKKIDYKVIMSSLSIHLIQEKDEEINPKYDDFLDRLWYAMKDGWSAFIDFITFIISAWPFAVLAFLIYVVYKKKRQKNK